MLKILLIINLININFIINKTKLLIIKLQEKIEILHKSQNIFNFKYLNFLLIH